MNPNPHLSPHMNPSQKRAVQTYRARLAERGMTRFEVLGLATDRELVRRLARTLAEEGPAADKLRASVSSSLAKPRPAKGGILAALRASPAVGAGLDLRRSRSTGRKVKL